MPSIRRKIRLGSFALVSIIALLALLSYGDLRYLEHRIESGVVIYEFLDAILEIRLEEKNFSLSSDARNKQSALDFAEKAKGILQQNRQAFLALQTESELQTLEALLLDYEAELSRYGGPPPGTEMPIGPASAILPQLGERLATIAESLASAERAELGTSVSRAQAALLASVILVALLGIAAAHLLSRFSVRPLAWLESEVAAIGIGRYNQLKPVSQDQEIVSVSRAVNRMLDDIETRNRHLLQSEKLASLGTLASGVAHELNNPLSNISSSCQILMEELEQQSPTDPMEWLGQIDKETERARLIVKSILDFSKENRVRKTKINLRELIRKSRLLLGQAGSSGFLTSAVSKDLSIFADAQKLQQVFINLFKNALDAGGADVTIQVRAQTASARDFHFPQGAVTGKRFCTPASDRRVLVIEVEDDGPGLGPDVLPRVFDPFFTTKDVGHGDGLGLYVAQEIVDHHGGCIGAISQPGKGTRFVMCLPQHEGETTNVVTE